MKYLERVVAASLTLSLGITAYASSARAASADENWDYRLGAPGVSGAVYAVAASGDEVYVGGGFTTAGGAGANYVARWNRATNQWSALGAGVDGPVRAIVVRGADVIVGGEFMNAGGVRSRGVARWSRGAWSAIGPAGNEGVDGVVRALAADASGAIYLGGTFTRAAQYPARNLAMVTTANAVVPLNGINAAAGADGPVHALAFANGELYVGGAFARVANADGSFVPAAGVARWRSNAWTALAQGLSGGPVLALAARGAEVYAGGGFTAQTPSGLARGVARWSASSNQWAPVGQGVSGNPAGTAPVAALATVNGVLYAGGRFTQAGGQPASNVARWDGARWTALGRGTDGAVTALAANGADALAGGEFAMAGGRPSTRLARWNAATRRASVHTANAANTRANYTYIEDPAANGDPNAIVTVTPALAMGGAGTYDARSIGVWYDSARARWAVYHADRSPMAAGTAFNVLVTAGPGRRAMVHRVVQQNSAGNATAIDSPLTNGNANAVLIVTTNWNPGGTAGGPYNNHPTGVFYRNNRWWIFNADMAVVPVGAAFNVLVLDAGAGAMAHTASGQNTQGHATALQDAAFAPQSAIVFATLRWDVATGNTPSEAHTIGVLYDNARARWAIFNEDRAAMRAGSTFNTVAFSPTDF